MNGFVGERRLQDGTPFDLRGDKTSALVTTQAHGWYQEAVLRGRVFAIQAKSLTVTATTDISPLPATTGRALVGVYNPAASAVALAILKCGFASVSGTPGGPFYLDVLANAGALVTNATQPTNALTQLASGSAAYAYAAAVPAQGVVCRMYKPLGGPAAIALGAGVNSIDEDISGGIVLMPGSLLALTAHATGTTHIGSAYLTWEEIPIPTI